MNVAIILAGGSGTRMNMEKPKQFIEVMGKPIVVYTVEVFQSHPEIDEIEIVCVEEYMDYMEELVEKYGLTKVRRIVKGGANFQYSVINGIAGIREKMCSEDIVLVHYAASPFVSGEIISDGIRVAGKKGNAASATPCFLLMGTNDDGRKSTKWVDRDKLMQLNSPQCFQFGYIEQLYEKAGKRHLLDKVEPHTTSLMYAMGETIYFSKGNQTNIKITTKEDLELFEGYVLMKQEKCRLTHVTVPFF